MRGTGSSFWETEGILSQASDLAAALAQARGVLHTHHTLPRRRCHKAADYQPPDLAKLDGGFEDAIYELIGISKSCQKVWYGR